MNEMIQWPGGEFTIQQAMDLNPTIPQVVIRKKIADDMAAKKITQTKKGDGKIKGMFQAVGGAAPV